jgi:hypothetical protein
MDKAPGVLIANQRIRRPAPVPRLRLLIEWEPRRRVFLSNLAGLLWARRVPQPPITSRPAPFWNDVFVPAGVPWSRFLESILWHALLLIVFIWGQSRVWVSVELFPQRNAAHRTITYYPPTPSFRAAEGRAPTVRPRSQVKSASVRPLAHQRPMPVTPEHKPSLVTPPDIKQATATLPNLPGSHAVAPMVPFSATGDSRRNALTGPSAAVAPAPQVDQAAARPLALPQASAVAPAPEIASAGRALKAPNTAGARVVPPPPSVQNAGSPTGTGRLGSLSATGPNVVAPPPSVQRAGTTGRLSSMAGAGSQVVPPPPSVQNAGNSAGTGRMSSTLSAAGPSVVAPPPSVQGAGSAGRLSSMAGTGSQVVPPPPSVQNGGNSAGAGRMSSSLSAGGPSVVAPPPSVQGAGTAGRLGSMAGAASQVVPPPPSVQGGGGPAGSARLGSLSGSEVVPPPPSVEAARNSRPGGNGPGDASPIAPVERAGASGTGKVLEPMDPLRADGSTSTPAANGEQEAAIEGLPLGLIGVVFAPPGTSFFSNFEVFVAKRRVGKDQLQLIKLVYEFLPYQRRLSEYNLNNLPARVIKLKVTPDPSCDESLGQMIQPHANETGLATQSQELPAALRATDLTAVLPCYRATADDFQKAMSKTH